jgi:hypothetical protein
MCGITVARLRAARRERVRRRWAAATFISTCAVIEASGRLFFVMPCMRTKGTAAEIEARRRELLSNLDGPAKSPPGEELVGKSKGSGQIKRVRTH